MKKILSLIFLPLLMMALVASPSSAWGPATHAYIGKKLGRKFGYLNLQEMYGAMAPDFPWIMFDLPEGIRNPLGYLTHYEYMNVVNEAEWRSQKAFAYGFATHNEVWGADWWAHFNPRYTKNQADTLVSNQALEGYWEQVEGFGLDPDWVAELVVEYGIDILIKQNEDPEIGLRVLGSASVRSGNIPWLLVRAYAGPLAGLTGIDFFKATKIIIDGEEELRRLLISYGMALSQEDEIDAVAEIAATQFGYLIDPPADPEVLKEIAVKLINAAMDLCAPDYPDMLKDTIKAIKKAIKSELEYPYLFLGTSGGYGFDK